MIKSKINTVKLTLQQRVNFDKFESLEGNKFSSGQKIHFYNFRPDPTRPDSLMCCIPLVHTSVCLFCLVF